MHLVPLCFVKTRDYAYLAKISRCMFENLLIGKKVSSFLLISFCLSTGAFSQFQLVGNALQTGPKCYQLTANAPTQAGAIWSANLLDLSQPFDIHVSLFMGCDDNGADGMAFVLQQVSTSVGTSGGGMGYSGISPSLAVEFDTYQNTTFGDPAVDHIALMRNGDTNHGGPNNLSGPVNLLASSGNIEDCAFHTFRFVWNPTINQFRVFVDCQLRLTYVGNVINNIFAGNPNVFWGFTAGTGALANQHQVCVDFVSFIEGQRDTFMCQGDTIQWSVTPGVSYAWTPTTGVSNPTAQNVSLFPSVSTVYTVNVTDACGFIRVHEVEVDVQPQPIVSLGNDTTICPGDSLQLLASGGIFYEWDPDPTLSDPFAPDPFVSPSTPTEYRVLVTSAFGCETRDTITVGLNAAPTLNLSVSSPAVCDGFPILAQASGGVSYQWSPMPLITNAIQDSALYLPVNLSGAPLDTTWLVVTLTDTLGCQATDSIAVAARPLPPVNAGPDITLCFGDTATLSASGAAVYAWEPSAILSDTTQASVQAFPLTTTLVTVVGADVFGCVNADQVLVNVQPLPVANAGPDTSVCLNNSIQLLATGGTTYLWDADPTLTNGNQANPTVAPTVATVYAVTVTDAFGCTDRDSVLVRVNALPVALATVSDAQVCAGDSVTLSATGGEQYLWFSDGVLAQANFPVVRASMPNAGVSADTLWSWVQVIDTNQCRDFDSVFVEVRPLPSITVTNDTEICIGDTIRLSVEGGQTYLWSPDVFPNTIQRPTVRPTVSTTYFVTATDVFGCQNSDSVRITVNSLPVVDAGIDTAICRGQPYSLSASGALLYEWSPAAFVTNAFIPNPGITPEFSTDFVVIGRDVNGCVNRDSVFIEVFTEASIRGDLRDSICRDGEALLTAVATAPGGTITYLWSTGATTPDITVNPTATNNYWVVGFANGCPSDTLRGTVFVSPRMTGLSISPSPVEGYAPLAVTFNNTSTDGIRYEWDFGDGNTSLEESPVHTYLQFGLKTVTMVGINEIGCRDTIFYEFIDVWEPELYIPSAFTPNGDLSNDEYFVSLRGIQVTDARIYDRWGVEVFASDNPDFRWDGKFNGRDVPEGVYILVLKATDTLDRVFVKEWPITLFR